ncbi:peroxiredoxin [Actinobacteria bacterium YIM 96077]|uniref:thioredoxin-dependent peroxiredoxin n=1 Tax=Phytoactinopolyspora halophila TaxID=1981511 RepID=A0A329QP69_9ACTN|nr:peroxiredoxin [Phytoactinopolyspora halophila]AYY15073.1 peroxiredoxin [Actinobacteria bacterium YIM 96077]RAW14164.1 peroxiredoxin [Phytoactinopolyspora halophila]
MNVGDTVDDFELPDQQGERQRLRGLLANGPVVLFFYPLAMSRGCTAQACHFRDLADEFRAVGAQAVGVSADPVERQEEFARRHQLGMMLLSDPDKTVAQRFGVQRGPSMLRGLLPDKLLPTKRHTFVIDTDLRVVEIIRSELNMDAHADRALETLRGRRSS